MKSVQLINTRAPLEEREIPVPMPGPLDLLIKVKAAGICHSDAHYRAGISSVNPLPCTLGHEVAGVVESIGNAVTSFSHGDRVVLHYMVTCGHCRYCDQGEEQFCRSGKMIGKDLNGGYAEYISVPARSAFVLPDEISFPQGAVMMCSSATSLHALNKARLKAGESVAVFGIGGLGFSAIQLARALGASSVIAIDIRQGKLDAARKFGALTVNAAERDAVKEVMALTSGKGVDVALELIGLPVTMEQAVKSLAIKGRATLAGLTSEAMQLLPYQDLIGKEAEVIGVSDHLASELPQLLDYARSGKLDLSDVISQCIPLEAEKINAVLDDLAQFSENLRTVITP